MKTQKKAAIEAAKAAKIAIQEQKLKEKRALDETKRVIAEQKAKCKEEHAMAMKRLSVSPASADNRRLSDSPTENDTVPATLVLEQDLE